jgi:hypothetical protein
VHGYPGTNLRTVTLAYGADAAGTYRITLLARRNTYDGPIIGSPQTAFVTLPNDLTVSTLVSFDFAAAPVSTSVDDITFTHSVIGPGHLFMDVGVGPCPGVEETDNTLPPHGAPSRNNHVGLRIVQDDLTSVCIPSDTVLCIDNNLGDKRFKVTMNFSTSQGGGLSGPGQAIPTKFLGVVHGGLMFFFSQDNPEVLVKVLNACGVNNKFWVFITAGTNVHFSITVLDTVTGHFTTYNNPDLNPAPPIQDTSALPCP